MHSCVIVPFETTDKRFLRLISEQLENLKRNPQKSATFLQTLTDLSLNYMDILPKHFFELLNMIKDLIGNYAYYEHLPIQLHKTIDRILLLCNLLQEEPSVELFNKFIQNDFETICEYNSFPEDVVLSLISSLAELPDESKKANYAQIRIFWIVISNMDLSKEILLSAIKNTDLKGNDFIDFCKDIAVSTYADEEVLLTLINQIESKKISVNSAKNNYLKFEIYATIIKCALPSDTVVKKIVEIIIPKGDNYFKFFYEIIEKFRRSKTVMDAVINRLNTDEPKISEEIKVSIRRLKLIALNT